MAEAFFFIVKINQSAIYLSAILQVFDFVAIGAKNYLILQPISGLNI